MPRHRRFSLPSPPWPSQATLVLSYEQWTWVLHFLPPPSSRASKSLFWLLWSNATIHYNRKSAHAKEDTLFILCGVGILPSNTRAGQERSLIVLPLHGFPTFVLSRTLKAETNIWLLGGLELGFLVTGTDYFFSFFLIPENQTLHMLGKHSTPTA